jgi:tellurite methyltransferase
MPTPLDDWDARYRDRKDGCIRDRPAAILCEALPLVPPGRALDVAAGAGADAVFLAENGWRVTAIDFSSAALDLAERRAREHGVACDRLGAGKKPNPSLRAPGVTFVCADLERVRLPAGPFDLILCLRYLQRSLFSWFARLLRHHGLLICETYTLEQLRFLEGPHNRDHLLRTGELREALPSLEILFHRELVAGKGIASLVARKR